MKCLSEPNSDGNTDPEKIKDTRISEEDIEKISAKIKEKFPDIPAPTANPPPPTNPPLSVKIKSIKPSPDENKTKAPTVFMTAKLGFNSLVFEYPKIAKIIGSKKYPIPNK